MSPHNLRDEIKKRLPFDSLEQEALLNLWRTSDQLAIRFTRLFRQYGLTPAQYNILRILRGAGQPLPCLEIASRLITEVPGITGLIDRLEHQGLARRRRSEDDRRVVLVEVSPEALHLLAQLDQPVSELHRGLIGHLETHELMTLIALLEKARSPRGDSSS